MIEFLLVYENSSEESCKCPISLSPRIKLYNWIHFFSYSLLEKNPILQAGSLLRESIIYIFHAGKSLTELLLMVGFATLIVKECTFTACYSLESRYFYTAAGHQWQ